MVVLNYGLAYNAHLLQQHDHLTPVLVQTATGKLKPLNIASVWSHE